MNDFEAENQKNNKSKSFKKAPSNDNQTMISMLG